MITYSTQLYIQQHRTSPWRNIFPQSLIFRNSSINIFRNDFLNLANKTKVCMVFKVFSCLKKNECFRLTYFSDTILVVQSTCHSLYQITKVPVRVFLTSGAIYLQAIWCSTISINKSKLNMDKNRIVWLNIIKLKHFYLYLEWWSTAGPEYSQKQSCSMTFGPVQYKLIQWDSLRDGHRTKFTLNHRHCFSKLVISWPESVQNTEKHCENSMK